MNYKKFWGIFTIISISLVSIFLIIIIIFGKSSHPQYSSIQECINSRIEEDIEFSHSVSDPEQFYTYASKIISFENEKQYCEFYYSLDNTVWFVILDKITSGNEVKYSIANRMTFSYYSDDINYLDGYEFQCADSSEQIDIDGAELHEITFTLNGKPLKRVLAFKDNSANFKEQ